MKKYLWVASIFLIAIMVTIGALVVPNPLGAKILAEAKYRGYLPYTPDEAVALAYSRCSTCHPAEKTLKYCSQCGPPFVVVSHSMKKYVELLNQKGATMRPFSDPEIVAITQVWNGLVGNWETGWGSKNITKLLQGDTALVRLYETPVEERPIEMALKNRSAPGSHHDKLKKEFH